MIRNNSKKNNNNLKEKKDCAINSLKEVELFLHNFNIIFKSLKIYKFLK